MNGTSSLTSAGVSSSAASIPHELDEAIRRLSSSIRSGVRATSMPPLSGEDAELLVLARRCRRVNAVISLRVVGQEDEVRGVAGRAAGVRQRALLEQDDVAPAEPGEVVDHAVADDAGADDDDLRARGEVGHRRERSYELLELPLQTIRPDLAHLERQAHDLGRRARPARAAPASAPARARRRACSCAK